MAPWIGEQRAIAAQHRDAIRGRADRQHSWALRGDSRGFYGAEGAELMRRVSSEPHLDDIAANTGEPPEVSAVTDTAEGLAALLTERPPCWRYAVFASVLVQRRATLQRRLRDQQLGYAPPRGERIHTGFELGHSVDAPSAAVLSVPRVILTLRHEMPSPSSDWTARQPHARGWLG